MRVLKVLQVYIIVRSRLFEFGFAAMMLRFFDFGRENYEIYLLDSLLQLYMYIGLKYYI